MTTQVAVQNAKAVALASDSAVTITFNTFSNEDGQLAEYYFSAVDKDDNGYFIEVDGKRNDLERTRGIRTLNFENKIFQLGEGFPVGIMVAGSAEFQDIPWDNLIGYFLAERKGKRCERLWEYTKDFIDFLNHNQGIFFDNKKIDSLIDDQLDFCFGEVYNNLRSEKNESFDLERLSDEINESIAELEKDSSFIRGFSKKDLSTVINKHKKIIEENIDEIFSLGKLPSNIRDKLIKYGALHLTTYINRLDSAEITIAGFGEKDLFPVVSRFITDFTFINKKLRNEMKVYISDPNVVTYEDVSDAFGNREGETFEKARVTMTILGQDKAIDTFLFGIDPNIEESVNQATEAALDRIFEEAKYSDEIRNREKFSSELMNAKEEVMKQYRDSSIDTQLERHRPMKRLVSTLTPIDLAIFAEELVEKTIFEKKYKALEMDESVGGPVDVAIITRASGFTWYKNKLSVANKL